MRTILLSMVLSGLAFAVSLVRAARFVLTASLVLAGGLAAPGIVHAEPAAGASVADPDDLLPWERDALERDGLAPASSAPDAAPDAALVASSPSLQPVPAIAGETAAEDRQEATEEPAGPPHPAVTIIRGTLVDKDLAKKDFAKNAPEADIAALQMFYEASSAPPLWVGESGLSAKGQAVLAEIGRANDWGLEAKDFTLPDADSLPDEETARALAEIKIDLAVLKYARFAKGGRQTPSKISDHFDQTPALLEPAAVMAEVRAAPAADAYLRSLHPSHEQFARLRDALVAARAAEKPNETDIKRLVLNMERWRWMPEDLGAFHVWLNTPEFMLYVVKDGKTVYTDKTLVGTVKYPTPVFSAAFESIVFNPDWIAPPSVLRDKLWPALKRKDFNVIKSNQLRVSYKGRHIDPTKIDWRRTNIHRFVFTQKSGPKNVLGKAKFLYPNEHYVYMHDTLPYSRKIFKKSVRAFGNGCVRMENPKAFAELVLGEDQQFPKSEVKALWDKGVNSPVTLKTLPPVHTTYFTAVVDQEGTVATFKDLYGLDRKHAKALFGSNDGFVPARRTRKRKTSNVTASGGNGLSNAFGLFGN